ncbi:MAG: hypothetical protein GY906_22455 [bacterium]|nr:hypothetical protein [bacterium]
MSRATLTTPTEKLIARTGKILWKFVPPPRDIRLEDNILKWSLPADTTNITHTLIRIDKDIGFPDYVLPVPQESLQLFRGSTVVASCFNAITGQESAKVSRDIDLNLGVTRRTVLEYGAVRGRKIDDAAITAASQTFTSATANFTAEDVGRLVVIEGAGTDGTYHGTTISAVTDSATVTLTDAAGTTVSGATAGIGPDSTDGFNAALADVDYVEIPFGTYILNGKVTLGEHTRLIGDSRSTVYLFNGDDDFTFEMLTELATPASTKVPLITGMRFENFTLYAKNGIKLNREWDDVTTPENPESDWDKQGFILGVIVRQVYFRGEYNSALDANYETATAPTLSELRGYGVAFHTNKLFDSQISLCDFRQYGLGILFSGCDINEISTTRLHQNARHWQSRYKIVTGVDFIGSSNNLSQCDMLVNYRVGGIYLDSSLHHTIFNCFFENPATARDSTTYLITTNDLWTRVVENRFSTTKGSGSGTSTPYFDVDPRWGLEFAHNTWNVGVGGVPEVTAKITTNSWSTTYQQHVRFLDNDPELPLPDAPLQDGAYDEYRLDYKNWQGVSGPVLSSYPFIQSGVTGRWVFQVTTGSLFWNTSLKRPSHRRLLFEYWARKITAGGGQSAFYLEDVGTCTVDAGTDVISSTGHGQNNDDRVQFRTTATLPDPLVQGTSYWVINATANTLQVSTSQGGAAVDITDTGVGTHYLRHRDELYNQTHGHSDTTKATYFRHTGRLPSSRRGDGELFLIFDNTVAELESIQVTPIAYELASAIPTDSDHDVGDVVFNTLPEKVEPYGWVFNNASSWMPLARFGNGLGYDFLDANDSLGDTIHMIAVDTTTGDITLTLPDGSDLTRSGMWYFIQNLTGGNAVILDAAGADTINNAATYRLERDDQVVLLMCYGAGKWQAQHIGNQYEILKVDDHIELGINDSPTFVKKIESLNGTPEGVITANAGSLALDDAGVLWLKESGVGNTGWKEVSGLWAALSSDEIGTTYQVRLEDTSNSRPMQLRIEANIHANQASTALINAEGFLVNYVGRAKAKALGVNYDYPATDGWAAISAFLGVGTNARNASEALHVSGASRLNGALELPTLTALRACYTDGSKNLISSTVTNVELAYLAGVTSALQTQLNDRYTKAEVDALLANKVGTTTYNLHTHTNVSAPNHDHGGAVAADGGHNHIMGTP